jgi:hypothetical protein
MLGLEGKFFAAFALFPSSSNFDESRAMAAMVAKDLKKIFSFVSFAFFARKTPFLRLCASAVNNRLAGTLAPPFQGRRMNEENLCLSVFICG